MRFTSKFHHVFIKSIRMLNTLSLSINEIEVITKKSIRSNSKSLQQCMIAILISQNSKSSKSSKFSKSLFLSSNSLCAFFVCFFALTSLCFRCCWMILNRNELTVHLTESLTVHLIWKRLSRNRKIELKSLLKVRSEERVKHRKFEIESRRSNKLKRNKSHKRKLTKRKKLTRRNLYARDKINDFNILESRELSTSEIVKCSLSFFCTISFFCCFDFVSILWFSKTIFREHRCWILYL